jgi:hypothetical protein
MMSVAKRWEWRNDNPCEGIPKFPEEKRDRWLSTEEIERLCDALDKHPNQSAATRTRGASRGLWLEPCRHLSQKLSIRLEAQFLS